MEKKSLKYFMRDTAQEIVTVPGPESFKDEEGKIIDFEIKVLPQSEIMKINDAYRIHRAAKDKKGNPLVMNGEIVWETDRDSARASRHLIVEALQYPDLKDPDLMKHYNCVDVTEMPLLVCPRADEYQHVTRIVMKALGLLSDENTDSKEIEAAKN